MVMHPLEGSWAKLDRANGHRHAIEDGIERWRENHPHEFIHDQESQPGWTILTVKIRTRPPVELGAIVGDYVHNLRSALDHLVWQLVIANGGTPGRHTEFPIALTEPSFAKRAITGTRTRPGMLTGVAPHVIEVIRRYQPCERGDDAANHPFAILQDLWNADKHQTITQVVTLFEAETERSKHLGRGGGIEPPTSRPIEDGMELDRWVTPPLSPRNPDGSRTGSVHSVGRNETGVLFGESRITLDTLASLRKEAKSVVDLCARFFR
jgi:hypothetical protein